ncbi:MAG: hypothetical protein O2973_10670 [Gemmatimonadetes bacterium]|nr:hypothetical protein [Gemmatimonadota bacterium]
MNLETKPKRRSLMESVGVYLPPESVSMDEIVKGCTHKVLLPLKRLTGIESVRIAGETEFSHELGLKAVHDCLAMSKYGPGDIDLIMCCNISYSDGPDEYTMEPGRAVRLRDEVGMHGALAFDITNACAGMFTGVYLADALIRAGEIRRALVVSGEHITHLMRTAQQEISGLADPRLACLTLGDAGAAVLLDGTDDPDAGLHGIELYTLGRHSELCTAKVTDQPHGGVIMKTDMIALANIALTAYLQHSAYLALRLGWRGDSVDHIIPHQTSKATLDGGSRKVKDTASQLGAEFRDKVINNVTERGNTATTSHFVALKDCIRNGKIKSGEGVIFGILASGVTVGTAVYRLDDLPERCLAAMDTPRPPPPAAERPAFGKAFTSHHAAPRVRLESLGAVAGDRAGDLDTMDALVEASEACLDGSTHERGDIGLLLSTGVYRTDFLSEPALAALLAGRIAVNDAPKSPLETKTLAFDIVNSGLGFLNACYIGSALIRNRPALRAMIATSEVENNAQVAPECPRGIRETASAAILDLAERDGTGFGAFTFQSFPREKDALRVYGTARRLKVEDRFRARLFVERQPDLEDRIVKCVTVTVNEILEAEGLSRDDIKVVLPPQISSDMVARLGEAMGFESEKLVDACAGDLDLFTSSIPYGMAHIRDHGMASPGDLGLIVCVAAGIDVGCALYHF